MKTSIRFTDRKKRRLSAIIGAAAVCLLPAMHCMAYPLGRVTFYTDAPFAATSGTPAVTASGMQNLVTVAGWADSAATVPANLYQWWWILGVDSGAGNGALIDGTECLTLQFDKSVGAAMIYFLYTGGSDGTTNNLARLSISGFASDPGAMAVTYNAPRITNLSYTNGTLSFDYLNDAGNDYGQLMLANGAASAGRTLKLTGAVSPKGDATSWHAALYRVDVQEAYGGPQVNPTSIPANLTNRFQTADGALTIRGYADAQGTTLANFGRYQDECFGVYGSYNNAAVDTNECLTLQFAADAGLARLDCLYSSGPTSISGFGSDPGFTDPSNGSSGGSYWDGVLTFTPMDGGLHSFYFNNRAASAGRTLRINVADAGPGSQVAIARIGYTRGPALLASEIIANNFAMAYATPDGLLNLSAFWDTPGTVPTSFYANVDWFGIAGGNNSEAVDATESLQLGFAGGTGLSGLGTRYTSGQIILSGFASDPGFSDPSGTAT
ncbi:MAG TPA: hypothetical protein VNT26_03545, partial [Candidatus Sulfotelmatobacter sp.]|nr:hypothetical protein [Candidatus Sulfotelmatobacter sp.]